MAKTLDQLLDEGRFTSFMKRALKALFNFIKPYKSYVANVSVLIEEKLTIVSGKTYVIENLVEGDNFTNIGFVEVNVPFIATGTTPTSWVGETVVYEILLTKDVLQNELDDSLIVSYDWVNNRVLYTLDNGIFVAGKLHLQVPSNAYWTRVSENVVAIYNVSTIGGVKESIRIDVYN